MQHERIRPGMVLRLKPTRQAAYGLEAPRVHVDELIARDGYKVPFVRSGEMFFTPADFAREEQGC
jgi:hypothetical protein